MPATPSELAAKLRKIAAGAFHPDEFKVSLHSAAEAIDDTARLRDLIDMLHERLRKADENMRAMQRDQLESDKGAMMFIAALVDRFGEDYNDGKLVVLSDLQLLKASEMTLGKANPPSGGLRLWTSIERETEAALREGYNKVRAELPPVSPFRTSLELPPDHVITGDAAAARGARMLKTAAPGEKT